MSPDQEREPASGGNGAHSEDDHLDEHLDEHLEDETPDDRRRVLVIAAFVILSVAVAAVLAILYGMPAAP